MITGSTERLTRWTKSLEARIQEAEAELGRPLCSPWLRCACGVFQAARLVIVMRDGLAITLTGLSLSRRAAQAHDVSDCEANGRATAAAAGATAKAGITAMRAIFVAASSGCTAILLTGAHHDRV